MLDFSPVEFDLVNYFVKKLVQIVWLGPAIFMAHGLLLNPYLKKSKLPFDVRSSSRSDTHCGDRHHDKRMAVAWVGRSSVDCEIQNTCEKWI